MLDLFSTSQKNCLKITSEKTINNEKNAFFRSSHQRWCSVRKCVSVSRGVLLEKVFLEISQNSQENTCTRVSFLIKLNILAHFLVSLLLTLKCQ